MRRAIVLVAAGLASLAPIAARQTQQQPTFKAGVRTVPVYVTVSDGAGGFALDLTKDDFEVKDNGKVQTITQFTTTSQPLSTLLMLDGSSSMWPVLKSVLAGANSFIVRMLPTDRTAIASFADRFQMRQSFTSDRDVLLGHLVDQFNVRLGLETRLYDAMVEGALALGKESGRRVIVVLSDGKNWVAPQTTSARATDVVTAAISRDVMIYGIAMWTNWDGKTEEPSRALNRMADETGGGAVELRESDDINKTFGRVAQELHQQYVLGFTPAVLDGKVHRLEVRVKQPNTRVRARRSYVASEKPEGGGRL